MSRRIVPKIDTPVTDIAGRISPRLNNKGQVEGTSERVPTTTAHSTTNNVEESSAELQRQCSVEICELPSTQFPPIFCGPVLYLMFPTSSA